MNDAGESAPGFSTGRLRRTATASESPVRLSAESAEECRKPSPLEEEVLILFDSMHDRLLAYVLRFHPLTLQDCEEVVQETFLALFLHLQRDRSRENLNGWLFRVANNFALKRLQAVKRTALHVVPLTGEIEETAAARTLNPEDTFARDEAHQRLRFAVKALPEQEQRCLALRAEGLRYREIAEVLGMSLGAVAKSLERSLARITRASQR